VEALTAGSLFDVADAKAGVFSLGADITAEGVPANLRESYGSPASYHVFVH
jgi:hypothetical protein